MLGCVNGAPVIDSAINLCFEDTTFQILQVAFIALLLLARVLKLAAAARYRSTAVVSSVLPHHTVADVKRALATALNDGDNVQSLTLNGYVLKDGHDGEFAAMYGVLVPIAVVNTAKIRTGRASKATHRAKNPCSRSLSLRYPRIIAECNSYRTNAVNYVEVMAWRSSQQSG